MKQSKVYNEKDAWLRPFGCVVEKVRDNSRCWRLESIWLVLYRCFFAELPGVCFWSLAVVNDAR